LQIARERRPRTSCHSRLNDVETVRSIATDSLEAGNGPACNEVADVSDAKVVFVAFAIEDERQRDFLKGQSQLAKCPFDFIDMSVKERYETGWKDKVRTRIKRSDGVIALISKDSLTSTGQAWEIDCARDEKKRILGVWAYSDDRTTLEGVRTVVWKWETIRAFIESL
jgi:hypothetical protein